MRTVTAIACSLTLLGPLALADDLGFDGDIVEPDCVAMSPWFNCRDIDTVDPNHPDPAVRRANRSILRGYAYMHHTSSTLGPDGNVTYPDGAPYATATTACSSCHFTGGHVPFGTPVYQSPSKYAPLPYFRPLGYKRDLEDSIIDCFRNCMNADRSPTKTDPVMRDLVAYIDWVADGIIDPAMRENWLLLPPEAGPNLPVLDPGIYTDASLPMRPVNPIVAASPARGQTLYNNRCAECHDEDGPGLGEYREGENRPRTPALWGLRDGHSTAAAFYRNGVLGAYIQTHMPFEEATNLTDQQALDIAAFINAPDKDAQRTKGQADRFFCFNDPDGVPSALRKNADWWVGCEYRDENDQPEPFAETQIRNGPWAEITTWRNAEIARRLASPIAPVAVSDPVTLDNDDAFQTGRDLPVTINVLANDTHPIAGEPVTLAELSRIFPERATATDNGDGTVTYTPPAAYLGEGGFVYRTRDSVGLWSNYATALVAVMQPVDLSIRRFTASNQVRLLPRGRAITFELRVHNATRLPVPGPGYPAQLVGVQNGQTVHMAEILVSDPPTPGVTTSTSFPSYKPATLGPITWTVTVLDGDGDSTNDQATWTTQVVR